MDLGATLDAIVNLGLPITAGPVDTPVIAMLRISPRNEVVVVSGSVADMLSRWAYVFEPDATNPPWGPPKIKALPRVRLVSIDWNSVALERLPKRSIASKDYYSLDVIQYEIYLRNQLRERMLNDVPDAVTITIPSTIELQGRALVSLIELTTKLQLHPANSLYQRINPRTINEESVWSQWIAQRRLAGEWQLVPRKSHVLPTEGGCSFDSKEPIFVDRSPAEHARKRQFLGIHSRWYSIEGRGHSHWTARHEEVVRAHAQVHTDLVGSPATDCQFCLLSRVILRHALKRECVAFVLRGISANRAAKTLRLIAEWMLANDPSQQGATINALERMISQIAKSPTP